MPTRLISWTRRSPPNRRRLLSHTPGENAWAKKSLDSPGIKSQPNRPRRCHCPWGWINRSLSRGRAAETSTNQIQKLQKTKDTRAPRGRAEQLTESHKARKSIRLPPIPWLEKNLCPKSGGIVEKTKIGQATVKKCGCEQVERHWPTSPKPLKTLIESGSTRKPRKGLRREPNRQWKNRTTR